MNKIPEYLFAREFDLFDAPTVAFERVSTPWPSGMGLLVRTEDIEAGDIQSRHSDENPAKCAKSKAAARRIELWNVSDADYPVTLTEFNWLDGGAWRRAYGLVEDGYHRIEAARDAPVEAIWIHVNEHRFAPPRQRPPDRAGV